MTTGELKELKALDAKLRRIMGQKGFLAFRLHVACRVSPELVEHGIIVEPDRDVLVEALVDLARVLCGSEPAKVAADRYEALYRALVEISDDGLDDGELLVHP
jgi:hypothetical protein